MIHVHIVFNGVTVLPIRTKMHQPSLPGSTVVSHGPAECQGLAESRLVGCSKGGSGEQEVMRVVGLSHLHNQGFCVICPIHQGYGFSPEEGSGSLKSLKIKEMPQLSEK